MTLFISAHNGFDMYIYGDVIVFVFSDGEIRTDRNIKWDMPDSERDFANRCGWDVLSIV